MEQLDLLSPPSMNPNKSDLIPDCFRDYQQYEEWLRLARSAKQPCTICEDCVPAFQVKMKSIAKCHYEWHSVKVFFGKPEKEVKPIFEKPTKAKEFQLDPLSW